MVFHFPPTPISPCIQLQLGNIPLDSIFRAANLSNVKERGGAEEGSCNSLEKSTFILQKTRGPQLELVEFNEIKAEKGRIGCHRYIRGLNIGEEIELFNSSTMLAQEQLGTGCP